MTPEWRKTISDMTAKTAAWITAPTRMDGGNLPATAPPMAKWPKGAPRAKASWNRTITSVASAKIMAAVVPNLDLVCEMLDGQADRVWCRLSQTADRGVRHGLAQLFQ